MACVLAAALLAVQLLLGGCTGWRDGARRAVDAASRSAELAPRLVSLACDGVRDGCLAAADKTCAPLLRCHVVEREVHRGALAAQVGALAALAALEVADEPSAARLLAEVVRLVEPLRVALRAYGVTLP